MRIGGDAPEAKASPTASYVQLDERVAATPVRSHPRVEVRVTDLSLSVTSKSRDGSGDAAGELPTIANTMKQCFTRRSKSPATHKQVLKEVSGTFRPGTMTLVLGPSGAGKSALLQVLAGRFPANKRVSMTGEVAYNGQPREDLLKELPHFTALVAQEDKHLATLTVKETLAFANQCWNGNQVPPYKASSKSTSVGTDAMIQLLGLHGCQDTIIGDELLRGVSGGERKRVTLGEMEIGSKSVALMDEITTGLDSATAFDIVRAQCTLARQHERTIVMALQQPTPEVFALFDSVLLLSQGEVLYHGPIDHVEEYFVSLSIVRPPDRDLADFLLDVSTNATSGYPLSDDGSESSQHRVSELVAAFKSSPLFAEMHQQLDQPTPDKLMIERRPPASRSGVWSLVRRQLIVQLRNKPALASRVVVMVATGLLDSSTFFQFDPTQISVVIGTIYYAVIFFSISQVSQIPQYLAERAVFYKQRDASFFSTPTYVVAMAMSQVPMALVEAVVFGSLLYWISGFASSVSAFLIFLATLTLQSLFMAMWFFLVAAVAPDAGAALSIGMVSMLVFSVFAGFIVTESNIPGYFVWLHWLSPMSWALKALAINQFRSSDFDVCEFQGVDYCGTYGGQTMGEYYLNLFDIPSKREWIPYAAIYVTGLYAVCFTLSVVHLERVRHVTNFRAEDKPLEDKVSISRYTPTESRRHHRGSKRQDVALDMAQERHKCIPVTVAFKDLRYSVPDATHPDSRRVLLHGISGVATPGTVTALMGATGAGKTTLLDVVAGRKTQGTVDGSILLNGHQATPLALRRSTGYCEQTDCHSESATIREALAFSAFLRQDSAVSTSDKLQTVDECLDLLGLRGIADCMLRFASAEQKKRASIGVALAAQPSVLFLDEPTSGLDARAAKLIVDGLRKVADSGRTVVCTIHQPSAGVFALFDRLLLLQHGGETVYFGDLGAGGNHLIEYFEEIPGIEPFVPGRNPATWMLETIGAGVDDAEMIGASPQFAQIFQTSEHSKRLHAMLATEGIGCASAALPPLAFSSKRAASALTQLRWLWKRFANLYWRTPTYNLTRFAIALLLALVFGLIAVGTDMGTYQGLNSGIGLIFLSAFFNGMIAYMGVLPIAIAERTSFYRERSAETFNVLWYFASLSGVELPYSFAAGLLFSAVFFPLAGFASAGFVAFVLFWIDFSLYLLLETYLGQLAAFALPGEDIAAGLGGLVNMTLSLFMGFAPPAAAIPSGYRWLYKINPFRFALGNLVALVFGDCDGDEDQRGCKQMLNAPATVRAGISVREFVAEVFGMARADHAANVGYLLLYIVGLRVLALVVLRTVRHGRQ